MVQGLCCSTEAHWRFKRGRSRLDFQLFFFPLSLLKLNCQVTDLNKEASISFNNNSGKPTLVRVLCRSFLVFRLCLKKKKKSLNKFALFSGKQSDAKVRPVCRTFNLLGIWFTQLWQREHYTKGLTGKNLLINTRVFCAMSLGTGCQFLRYFPLHRKGN